MPKIIKQLLFATLLGLPGLAFASTIMPGGGNNAWDVYTMGNGSAIVQILQATVAIVNDSVYRTLLLTVATAGFIFLAIQAGFDFGKNFLRMFSYIIVVWFVVMTSTKITINLQVDDELNHQYQGVSDVPAVVGLPASIISGVGHWLAQDIATTFGVDPMLSVSGGKGGGLGGGFNIFGNMLEDANNFVITDPNLKKSIAAFTGDCVVSGLGMGFISPDQLQTSSNLWETMGKGIPPAVFTRYYPPTNSDGSIPTSLTCGTEQLSINGAMGTVASCGAAYTCITNDLGNHAQGLLAAKQTQWASTGALTMYAGAFQAAITQVGNGNNTGIGADGQITPQALVQQEALINEMHGAFRAAAVATGDNALLVNANVASAEQQQRSAFYVGSLVTEHMAGYIYTVLQAFLFALVPIIIVAMLIPGLGRQIAISYMQMLVWLALWEPMYEIVNFLIMAFSHQSVAVTFSSFNGPTLGSQYTMSEQTSNLVAAARMLGSSVPILALGLVKGGIALEKFAADALGSQFSNAAGSAAGLGAFNEGSVSLASVAGSKYNTASESVVGNGQTVAKFGGGTMLAENQFGGASGTINGGGFGPQYSARDSISNGSNVSHDIGRNETGSVNQAANHRRGVDNRMSNDVNRSTSNALQNSESQTSTMGSSDGLSHNRDLKHDNSKNATASTREGVSSDAKIGGGVKTGATMGAPGKQGPQQVEVVNGGGGGGLGAPGVGGVGAGGAPAAGAAGAAPVANTTSKSTFDSPKADIGFNGGRGMSSSQDSGLNFQSGTSTGESWGSSHSASSGFQLSRGGSHSVGTTDGHSMGAGSSSSQGWSQDHSYTHSVQSSDGLRFSSTGGMSHEMSRGVSAQGNFQQGRMDEYLQEVGYGNDGLWDSQKAANALGEQLFSSWAQQDLAKAQFEATHGADATAAMGGPSDPTAFFHPGNFGATTAPDVKNSWTELSQELEEGRSGLVRRQASTVENITSGASLVTAASENPFMHVATESSPFAPSGANVVEGYTAADKASTGAMGAGAVGTMVGATRSQMASRSAKNLASKVNP
jgi:hypothetical protein